MTILKGPQDLLRCRASARDDEIAFIGHGRAVRQGEADEIVIPLRSLDCSEERISLPPVRSRTCFETIDGGSCRNVASSPS